MKIIADTHIYYYLGAEPELYVKVKGELVSPTFLNIVELCKTENLIDREEYVREAVRKIFSFKHLVTLEPPFIHIAKMHCDYDYDPIERFGDFLTFTQEFAKGVKLDKAKIDIFRAWAKKINADFMGAANFANQQAEIINQQIKNKKEHWKKDTIQLTARFIEAFVIGNTQQKCHLEGFDLNQIELLIKSLDTFFKTLELSNMKMQANDWFDFALLAYVQPGDKIWTREKRWINLIKEAGCADYLIDF
jgi:hypothetical protein